MKRQIVSIDQTKCDGCGLCVSACAEGAIQLINGKARLVCDEYCDGLGACLGECPQGAIEITEREAHAFDPAAAEEHLRRRPPPSVSAPEKPPTASPGGCPGLASFSFQNAPSGRLLPLQALPGENTSALEQWPIQLPLVPLTAPFWQDADLLLAADCTAFSLGEFHEKLLRGKRLIIACPKLDDLSHHTEKLSALLARNEIRSLTVARMEVPCCGGLVRLAEQAMAASKKTIPFHTVLIRIQGGIAQEPARKETP